MKHIIDKFNNPNTCLVISDYPESNRHAETNHGIAWYTKELTRELANRYKLNFVVLAEKKTAELQSLHDHGHTRVFRVFDNKHAVLFPRVLSWLFRFNRIRNVHVHSEFCADGGMVNMILLIPFLMLIKLTGRRITYFSHNVVADLSPIATHLHIEPNSLALFLLNKLIPYYYQLLGIITDEIVVLDETIEKRLKKLCDPKKITLLPLWTIDHGNKMTKKTARVKLNIHKNSFVLLYFGFITYYKGADWLVDMVLKLRAKKPFQNIELIMAGGPAHSLKSKSHYKRYYKNILDLAKKDPGITITGFVKEADIAAYFKSADLFVLPYRDLMGASGSLIHALSYGVPTIVSDKTQAMLNNVKDVEKMVFAHTSESFEKLIRKCMKPTYLKYLKTVTKQMAAVRSRKVVVAMAYEKLFATTADMFSYRHSGLSRVIQPLYRFWMRPAKARLTRMT